VARVKEINSNPKYLYSGVPKLFERYSADSLRDNPKFSFLLLATSSVIHKPWIAAGWAAALAER
jgi:hypothetical protein